MIRITNLKTQEGKDPLALNGVNLDFRPREFAALLGREQGAAALVEVLAGMKRYQGGLLVDGKRLNRWRFLRFRRGVLQFWDPPAEGSRLPAGIRVLLALDTPPGLGEPAFRSLAEAGEEVLVVLATDNRGLAEKYATRLVEFQGGGAVADSRPYGGDRDVAYRNELDSRSAVEELCGKKHGKTFLRR